jgi:hypothetical protein
MNGAKAQTMLAYLSSFFKTVYTAVSRKVNKGDPHSVY